MKRKNLILLGVTVVCLGGAAFLATRAVTGSGAKNEDFPEGAFWICQACKHEFAKSIDEVIAAKAAARESADGAPAQIKCPSCGSSDTIRGLHCPSCKRVFVRSGSGRPTCSYCNTPLPAIAEGPAR